MSLLETDRISEVNAVAPRVSLRSIEDAIAYKSFLTGDMLLLTYDGTWKDDVEVPMVEKSLGVFTVCVLVMRNGFTVLGKAAPASPNNFNPDLGKQFAYEDAIRQLWPLMGYSLRDKLAQQA